MDKHTNSMMAQFIKENIDEFHNKRLQKLASLKLKTLLSRKNPYLFKAKNLDAHDLVKSILDAYLSSQEEAIFGTFLEKLAIYVAKIFCEGRKSIAHGIDLEFKRSNKLYIVSIKSGPYWGNSSQVRKMVDYFNTAKKIYKTNSSPTTEIQAICGCCYGTDDSPLKKDGYMKLCGKRFWEFITNDANFYIDIVEPLGYKAKEKNESFKKQYNKVMNQFSKQFYIDFCDDDGNILWPKIIEITSKPRKNG